MAILKKIRKFFKAISICSGRSSNDGRESNEDLIIVVNELSNIVHKLIEEYGERRFDTPENAPITDQFEEAGDNLTIHENSPVEEQRGIYDADNELDSLLDYLGVHYDIPNYYGTGQGHGFDNLGGYEEGQGDYDFDNYEGGFEDDREEGFDYYRDYDEYTITDPDENLDILEDEDVDEDADEEDFYQEPGVIEPSPDLYYSTLLMYSQQSFNVIKQPFNPFTTGDLPGRP